ncbi:phage minor tail protein L [Moraxella nasovis]|uniref:phage minor tail protein L n=1 Tax=Moraxella nasovis TaxID=2904121 RepID=UPI001F60A6A6|nr:phage minor tail protein L [Moraxella nasovis]UNU74101.1 phage minor tail protein L [Moraxella nasovis]
MSFNDDIKSREITGLVTLYELDATPLGAGIYRFHGHSGVINFLGEDYHPIAIRADGLEMRGDGTASMPKLIVADNLDGVQGAISALCRVYHDFAGARLSVYHTLSKYLDDAHNYKKQIWEIEQKTNENPTHGVVEFELSNPIDFEGQKIPVRNITNYCHWEMCNRYRGEECGYTGALMFDKQGNPVDNLEQDKCGGLMSDCKLRGNEDSFGGFVAAGLI